MTAVNARPPAATACPSWCAEQHDGPQGWDACLSIPPRGYAVQHSASATTIGTGCNEVEVVVCKTDEWHIDDGMNVYEPDLVINDAVLSIAEAVILRDHLSRLIETASQDAAQ